MKFTKPALLALAGLAGGFFSDLAAADSATQEFSTLVKPFFDAHCVDCHGPKKSKGSLAVHVLGHDNLADGSELAHWENILTVLRSGEMPPDDEPQPDPERRKAVAAWIQAGLRDYLTKADAVLPATTARRLTNVEYQNTINDLLGFEFDVVANLPEDPATPYHFNNTAEFMRLGPDQYDRYLENARRAMAAAIVDPKAPENKRLEAAFTNDGRLLESRRPDEVGVYTELTLAKFNLNDWPRNGEFRIRIKAGAILPDGAPEVPLRLVMGTALRHDGGFGNCRPVGMVYLRNHADDLQEFEFRGHFENFPLDPEANNGSGIRFLIAQNLHDNGELNAHRRSAFDGSYELAMPRAVISSVLVESPIPGEWPPARHRRILFDSPLRDSDPEAYARAVLERFVSRAFRRPATAQEVDRFVRVYRILAPQLDSFEAAMRETLSMVLVSPQFLYHKVAADAATTPAYELASKLSYFLWASMPDEPLLELAAKGQILDPAVIAEQVRRMLADPRAEQFVRNFTMQWLSIQKMHAVTINRELFPDFIYTVHVGERFGQEVSFRPTTRHYLEQETVGFISELIRRNANILSIVDTDFAWLNERLAVHYGVPGVKGMHFRPVALKPEHNLGGLLTQGSVLLANGTGSAPHPIYRAVWLREAILGDKVKAPPAEVPALVDTAGDAADKAVTIKDLLALHRKKESCNDCHFRLDPWGIPFEDYNAVGRFQAKLPKNGTVIPAYSSGRFATLAKYEEFLKTVYVQDADATAKLPHGPEVRGLQELKAYLLRSRKDDVVNNVIRRLLTYSLGRELTFRDRFAAEALAGQARAVDYRFQDVIVAICQSELFREPSPQGESRK